MPRKTTAWNRKSGITGRARELRRNQTEAEHYLWSDLRNRRLNGHKFSRQIPLGPYIADFICREKNLIIELDGSQHADSSRDLIRTKWLNANGYSVLRFWNLAVLQERDAVLDTIVAALDGRLTTHADNNQFYAAASKAESSGGSVQ
jgi:very-short-patch-repair endonuclease